LQNKKMSLTKTDENDRREHANGICLEGREITEHPLF